MPITLTPFARECTLEILILGCRGLKGLRFVSPKSPFVTVQVANSAGGSRLETSKKNKPTPESPNYGQVLSKSVYLPEDPDFAPVLTMFVRDVRFKGMGDVQLGVATIDLKDHLPW
eukprot:SAG22_NODE_87_length_21437_cov_14.162480_16_plen_116_part_00